MFLCIKRPSSLFLGRGNDSLWEAVFSMYDVGSSVHGTSIFFCLFRGRHWMGLWIVYHGGPWH